MARGDRHSNREAKKPKKLKPKEIGPISTLASIQKNALEAKPDQSRRDHGGTVFAQGKIRRIPGEELPRRRGERYRRCP